MILSHIVAASENNVIGVANDLPWHIPEDLKYFKEKTKGKIIIMGRKTYESIKKRPLPNRCNILVSKTVKNAEGFICVSSLKEAYKLAQEKISTEPTWSEEVFICGGGEIYKESLHDTNRIYLTRIHKQIDNGEVFYPEVPKGFSLYSSDKREGFTFLIYEKN